MHLAKRKTKTKTVKGNDLMWKTPEMVTVPFRVLEGMESLALGLRMDHVTCEDGGIQSGAGVGSPWIPMNWKGRQVVIHAGELLAAWVATFSPEDAADIRSALPNASGGVGVTASETETITDERESA